MPRVRGDCFVEITSGKRASGWFSDQILFLLASGRLLLADYKLNKGFCYSIEMENVDNPCLVAAREGRAGL